MHIMGVLWATLGTSQAMGSDFSGFRILAPTAMEPTVQVCGKAVGERQERLNHQSCGHIFPLKPFNGHPVSTATTLVGHGGRYYDQISTCSPGALHVGTPAGSSSVAYGRFEGATRPIV